MGEDWPINVVEHRVTEQGDVHASAMADGGVLLMWTAGGVQSVAPWRTVLMLDARAARALQQQLDRALEEGWHASKDEGDVDAAMGALGDMDAHERSARLAAIEAQASEAEARLREAARAHDEKRDT